MRKVYITRKKKFNGCALIYQIKCDDNVVATIRNGKTVVLEVDNNAHTIQCFAESPGNEGGYFTYYSDLINILPGTSDIKLVVKPRLVSLELFIE